MLREIYVITDLGPGDGGKGGVVHALAVRHKASLVIKRGGAQGSHGVAWKDMCFNFSQWGCGSFHNIPTYLSEQMVIQPIGLEKEAEALKELQDKHQATLAEHHIEPKAPYDLISADPNCIVTTQFHKCASQIEELRRGKNPRGTIGTGVGQAYRMSQTLDSAYTIHAFELTNPDTIDKKLHLQQAYYQDKYRKCHLGTDQEPGDAKQFALNMDLLFDEGYVKYQKDIFLEVGKKLKLESLNEVLQKHDGTAIVECSHGVLTDAETGLKPHVSAIRTLPIFTEQMLRNAGYKGKIIHYGVHRAYEIRHGAGPMPTTDPNRDIDALPGSHKAYNRWQGRVRFGALDLNLLNYALNTAKDVKFDGLCLTWFDEITKDRNYVWDICAEYANHPKNGEDYVEFLNHAKPIVKQYEVNLPYPELFENVQNVLNDLNITIPLVLLSLGASDDDKIIKEGKKMSDMIINNGVTPNEAGAPGTDVVPVNATGSSTNDAINEVRAKLAEFGADEMTINKILNLGIECLDDLKDLEASDLIDAGMKTVKARKLLASIKKQPAAANPVAETRVAQQLDILLPTIPNDESWLEALKTGGVLKIDDSSYIAAIRAALADRAGLYDIPKALVDAMEAYADATEEQLDPKIFFTLRKQLTRRSYGEIFAAIDGLDSNYVSEKRTKEFFNRIRTDLWPAIAESFRQLDGWYQSWKGSLADPTMLLAVLSGGLSGGNGIGMITPPDTSVVHDAGDTLINAINRVFRGTGTQVAAAMAYDAANIRKTLENDRLPAMVGVANRELMLKKIGANVSSNYVRLEQNLVKYVLAFVKHANVTSDVELNYFVAIWQLGSQINWAELGDSTGSGVKGLTGKKIL